MTKYDLEIPFCTCLNLSKKFKVGTLKSEIWCSPVSNPSLLFTILHVGASELNTNATNEC